MAPVTAFFAACLFELLFIALDVPTDTESA